MNQFELLTKILPPPSSPVDLPSEKDWKRVDAVLGTVPADYRTFVSIYGTGQIDQFIWILNPASANEYLNLVSGGRANLKALAESKGEFPETFTMSLFPNEEGFLPFGITDNGDTLYWVTGGAPDEWTVAVMGPRAPETFHFRGGVVDFLLAVLNRRVICDRFPNDFPGDPPFAFTTG